MLEPVRLPLFGPKQRLLGHVVPRMIGYWFLRMDGTQHRLTVLAPDRKRRVYDFDTAAEAVGTLIASYTEYLHRQINQLEVARDKLPHAEYHRAGFRSGWLAKLRRDLDEQVERMRAFARTDLADRLAVLHEAGWPQPTNLHVPWETVDAVQAAHNLWMPGDRVVPAGPTPDSNMLAAGLAAWNAVPRALAQQAAHRALVIGAGAAGLAALRAGRPVDRPDSAVDTVHKTGSEVRIEGPSHPAAGQAEPEAVDPGPGADAGGRHEPG